MKICLFILLLLSAGMAAGQSMTSTGSGEWLAPTVVSNFPDITISGGNFNAWHDMGTTAAKIFSDNEETYKVTSCKVSSYNDYPANTWTAHPEYGCVQVIHYIAGNLYALVHSQGSAGYALSKWNGSTWADISCCFVDFSGDTRGSGLFVAHDPGGTMWVSTNSGISFVHQAWCNPYPVSSEAAVGLDTYNNPLVVVACENKTIWQSGADSSGNPSWTQLPGSGKQVGVDERGTMYMLDLNGHLNHWTGSAWEAIAGNVSFFADGGPDQVWALNGSEVMRIAEFGYQWSRNYNGTVTCNVPPPYGQQICPTFTHTAKLQLKTAKKSGPVFSAPSWNGNGSWGITATVNTNDVFDCFSQTGDCQVSEGEGEMACSGGGNNFDGGPNLLFGVSIDNVSYDHLISFVSPADEGDLVVGDWHASVNVAVNRSCTSGGIARCHTDGVQTTIDCQYFSMYQYGYCDGAVHEAFFENLRGFPSPWTFYVPWVELSPGIYTCSPIAPPGVAHYKKYWEVPACQ